MSVTQSQGVDGTEPVTQAKDVPLQLQLEDERKRKKASDFLKRKELERRQKAAGVHPCTEDDRSMHADVLQPELVKGGVEVASSGHPGADGTDIPFKTNLLQTRLTQVFPCDGVKARKAVIKRKRAEVNPDGIQRRRPRVKSACQTAADKANGDSIAAKIGPSTLGGFPVRRSPRVLAYKKPSSSPLPQRSSFNENKKCKVTSSC